MRECVREALRRGAGVVTARDLPRSTLTDMARRGELTRLLPGTFCHPGDKDSLLVRAHAGQRRYPSATITGRTAAALTWWPELAVLHVELAIPTRTPSSVGQYLIQARQVPSEHRMALGTNSAAALWITSPALAVLDLIPEMGGRAIDEALRRRAARLIDLREALTATPHRRWNSLRERLLRDSRDEPWSEAERAFHRILRSTQLPERFVTNYPVRLAGISYFLDAALPSLRLAFEIDGFAHHAGRSAFEHDRRRDVALATRGWRIIRFSATQVLNEPEPVRSALIEIVRRTRPRAA